MGFPPNGACAACKFQRRKCTVDCLLAPWFPPHQPRRFANAHRLFGVAHILRLIQENKNSVGDLMKSVCFESDARERDPVHGVYGILRRLKREADILEEHRSTLAEKLRILKAEDAAAQTPALFAPAYNGNHPETYYGHARPTQHVAPTQQVSFPENGGFHFFAPIQQVTFPKNGGFHMQHQVAFQDNGGFHMQQQHQETDMYQLQQQMNLFGGGGFTPVQLTGAPMQLTDRSTSMQLTDRTMVTHGNHNTVVPASGDIFPASRLCLDLFTDSRSSRIV
ncbi:hypothetical protein AXG93_2564s1010 [Marchantia polymorpha subsp. ruderalis]|nr:hypothetical protein AXG93_2564s1010 [Marchantia polymorpha subsp. ruderalis]